MIKPKDKARALVDSFEGVSLNKTKMWGKEFTFSSDEGRDKQWAILLCDEMLLTAPEDKGVEQNKKFWEEVKKEIKKL